MKKSGYSVFLITLALIVHPAPSQTVVLNENFNGNWSTVNPPRGWEILFTGDTSSNDWHRAPDLGFNPWSDNTTPYAAIGAGEADIDMILDLRGCSAIVLRCSLAIVPGSGYAEPKIIASLDSGRTFPIEIASLVGQTLDPQLLTYDLTWAEDQPNVRIAFSLPTEETGITHWVIDNFSITAQRRATDAGITRILAPGDTVDSAAVITPRCVVFNPSSGTGSFWTRLMIGTDQESVYVNNLAPGESATITFPDWRADTAGIITALFQTLLPGDLNPENDTASRRVFVKPPFYNDCAALAILAPGEVVVETTMVIPRGCIANYAPHQVQLKVFFDINILGSPAYSDSITHILAPYQVDTVSFSSWIATHPGTYTKTLRVLAPRDLNPENDLVSGRVTVRSAVHDVGVFSILTPADTVPPGAINPEVRILNYGTFTESGFKTYFAAYRSTTREYYDSITTTRLAPGETLNIIFRPWNATKGTYTVRCSTALPDDAEPGNDSEEKIVAVRRPLVVGWQEMTPLPTGTKAVKNGGALTRTGNTIYALRGNKSDEFLAYDVDTDSWYMRASLPPGSNGKPVYNGSALTSDNNSYIYALKGNSSTTFIRYNTVTDTWETLTDVPLGPTRKPVKAGASMVYLVQNNTGYVYLLKGSKNEFWRYNTTSQQWESLPSAPLGPSGKESYKGGSFIVFDGNRTIYAVKAKYGEVFGFDITTGAWLTTRFQDFPAVGHSGRQKKVKDGAGGAWWNQAMYCLKGGNTNEFWRFFPAGNRWEELDTIPALGSTMKKKRIKAGGAIVSLGNGIFFALKGNKTNEFWCYKSPESGPGVNEPGSVPANPFTLRIYPNPTSGIIHGEISSPRHLTSTIRLYDHSGRVIFSTFTPERNFTINCQSLPPGVYFLSVENPCYSKTAKVIRR